MKSWLKTQHSENEDHGITSWQIDGETMKRVTEFVFLGSKITADGDAATKLKDACALQENYDQPRKHSKKRRHYFATKVQSSQGYGFPSSHVWM